MSRPSTNADKKRSRLIIFRVTEDEGLHLDAVANKAGLRTNLLARMLVTRRNHDVVITVNDRVDPALLTRLDRIGANLNQLVKNAHIFRGVSPLVEKLCLELRAIVEKEIDAEPEP